MISRLGASIESLLLSPVEGPPVQFAFSETPIHTVASAR